MTTALNTPRTADVPTLRSDRFTWDKAMRSFIALASELGIDGPPLAIDLRSARTGTVKRFVYTRVSLSPGGEGVGGWVYRNAETDTQLLIFND